ncbi:hypothetical protein [Streptomyces candidus]|uniref:Putative membrane protein n=1 Tax=Streptomyces candidus TaxID=67283 RepID=A0A7X0HH80_9ACTN|nr:hypothetical protein [Streptomyces candidus]MBB6437604.1 putative membrane protein [Streptomyces candidus]GHH53650.1 hypothetical protein GCM10018773_55490 [Streptomyces candidus]
MIVALIIACEVAFWILLLGGLSLRYLARMPRTGAAVLLCEPLLEVVLLVVTVIDLRNGAAPDWKHGLAAVYIGFTVAMGHRVITYMDVRFAHRYADGPPPVRPPKYGMARAVHEWKTAARWILACGIAAGLLQGAVWFVGESGDVTSLRSWQFKMGVVAVINVVIAGSYTLFPKRGVEEGATAVPTASPEAGAGAQAGSGERWGSR